ncbi:MAG: hypothetical protein PHQ23_02080 [Candidatus Wallbacteria bacterium]|nr:hypothetical protein [Candidatus Wallbacteria bacterium]
MNNAQDKDTLLKSLDCLLAGSQLDQTVFMCLGQNIEREKWFRTRMSWLHRTAFAWAEKAGLIEQSRMDDPSFTYLGPQKKKLLCDCTHFTGSLMLEARAWISLSACEEDPGPAFAAGACLPVSPCTTVFRPWRYKDRMLVFENLERLYLQEIALIREFWSAHLFS